MGRPVRGRTRGCLGNQEKEPLRNPELDRECLVRFCIKAQKPSLYDYGQAICWPVTVKLIRVFTDNGSRSAGLPMVLFSNTRPLRPHAEERS